MELWDFVSMEFDTHDTDQCHYMLTCMQLIQEEATSAGNTTKPCSVNIQMDREIYTKLKYPTPSQYKFGYD